MSREKLNEVENWEDQRTLNAFAKIFEHARSSINAGPVGEVEKDALEMLDVIGSEVYEAAKDKGLVINEA